jgi:hypothetical protein
VRSQIKWGKKWTDGYGGKLLNHLKKITVGLEMQNFVILRTWGGGRGEVGKETYINVLFLACCVINLSDKHQCRKKLLP